MWKENVCGILWICIIIVDMFDTWARCAKLNDVNRLLNATVDYKCHINVLNLIGMKIIMIHDKFQISMPWQIFNFVWIKHSCEKILSLWRIFKNWNKCGGGGGRVHVDINIQEWINYFKIPNSFCKSKMMKTLIEKRLSCF